MNSERFDDLARGLATSRLSRRQVLKGLLASAGVSLFSAVAAACGKQRTSSPPCPECGKCTQGTFDSSNDSFTQEDCASPCAAAELCKQATGDDNYQKLWRYLMDEGYESSEEASEAIIRYDGELTSSTLTGRYSHPSRPDESTLLTYAVKSTGEHTAFATVYLLGVPARQALSYLLSVNAEGNVEKTFPPPRCRTQIVALQTRKNGAVRSTILRVAQQAVAAAGAVRHPTPPVVATAQNAVRRIGTVVLNPTNASAVVVGMWRPTDQQPNLP
jgi:hypothetical protein